MVKGPSNKDLILYRHYLRKSKAFFSHSLTSVLLKRRDDLTAIIEQFSCDEAKSKSRGWLEYDFSMAKLYILKPRWLSQNSRYSVSNLQYCATYKHKNMI